jgi:hypothetical protein
VQDPCFMEGPVNLQFMGSPTPGPVTSGYLTGYIGDQYVSWFISGGWLQAPYKGEYLQLNYFNNGMSSQIQGVVHGGFVNWYGSGSFITGYQSCIP